MACICLEPYITESSCSGSVRQGPTFMAAQISGRKASSMVLYIPGNPCRLASLHNVIKVKDMTMPHDYTYYIIGHFGEAPPRYDHAWSSPDYFKGQPSALRNRQVPQRHTCVSRLKHIGPR